MNTHDMEAEREFLGVEGGRGEGRKGGRRRGNKDQVHLKMP